MKYCDIYAARLKATKCGEACGVDRLAHFIYANEWILSALSILFNSILNPDYLSDAFEVISQGYFRPYIQALNSGNYNST